jgi:hypothetical protein
MKSIWSIGQYNFGIVGFLFSAVYQYIHLTFLFILIVFHVHRPGFSTNGEMLKSGRWTSI